MEVFEKNFTVLLLITSYKVVALDGIYYPFNDEKLLISMFLCIISTVYSAAGLRSAINSSF